MCIFFVPNYRSLKSVFSAILCYLIITENGMIFNKSCSCTKNLKKSQKFSFEVYYMYKLRHGLMMSIFGTSFLTPKANTVGRKSEKSIFYLKIPEKYFTHLCI